MSRSVPSTSMKQVQAPVAAAERPFAAERGDTWAGVRSVALAVVRPVASLKLTVVLFALAVLLIYFGTLAQIENGIWYVLKDIFRAEYRVEWLWGLPIPWFAKIELRSLGFYRWDIPGHFYFPGGWMIGGVMLVNLLCAHALRFKVKARGARLGWGLGILAIGVAVTAVVIAGLFQAEVDATEAGSGFWRVLWRLTSGGVAAVVLYAGCVLVFYRRAGIVLLHGGIIFLLISELIAGKYAVEGQMRLREGGSGNHAIDIRSAELAVIDRSNRGFDQVISVPESRLERLETVSDAELPFDIKPVRFLRNHRLGRAEEAVGVANPATAGLGKRFVAVPQAVVSGVETDQGVDVDAAYLQFLDKKSGKSLGTYMFSVILGDQEAHETVSVAGRSFDVILRFRRYYKPYTIHLIDFRHDKYLGTQKAKSFSSRVRLVDPEKGVDREATISMNNPLRYRGETIYQASFDPTDDKVTVLQMVDNVGWMIPYVSCMVVAMGMIGHLWPMLSTFVRRRLEA